MRKYLKGIYMEKNYPGIFFGVVIGDGHALLIDAPIQAEAADSWKEAIGKLATPSYLILLDTHPERALGGRHFRLPRVAHATTAAAMSKWPDTYRGPAHPIGCQADEIPRITGVNRGVPEVIFREEMTIELPGRPVRLLHRPGPTEGAAWVEVPDKACLYIGDTVTVSEPPYLGRAAIDDWLDTLDLLRSSQFDEYRLFSSRDGLIERDDINDMARFLRKIPVRLERMAEREDTERAAKTIAVELLADFAVTKARTKIGLRRLEAGLMDLFDRNHPKDE